MIINCLLILYRIFAYFCESQRYDYFSDYQGVRKIFFHYLCGLNNADSDTMIPLEIFGFLKFSFTDVLDVLLVALIIYLVFRWIRGSAAMNIFTAVISIFVLKIIADALKMKMMSGLLGTFMDVGVLAIIVIFQPEIRHFLMRVGNGARIGKKSRDFLNRILGIKDQTMDSSDLREITEACRSMSEQKTGALIVIPHNTNLDMIIETGDRIDARINRRLIMNIFFKNSPLHDGAMIIGNHVIIAARCTLPITERTDIPARYGMRHKAAIGITEETDADVIVVSEETGEISFGRSGGLKDIGSINELRLLLASSLSWQGVDRDTTN